MTAGKDSRSEKPGGNSPRPADPLAKAIRSNIETSSWIRMMFEEGRRLKATHGEDNVFDFTLGNPSAPPPESVKRALIRVAAESRPYDHRYMTNVGLEETRRFIAGDLARQHGLPLDERHVVMTCGAAGGLNIFLKSILDTDDEVIILRPYFPEYVSYVANHGGRAVVVDTDGGFQPDLNAIGAALTKRTRAIIVNTPNNPTGVCYDQERIDGIARLAGAWQTRNGGRPIFSVMDEPYRRIRYTGKEHPSILKGNPCGVVVTSYSKDLGLAGERIGFLAVHPELPGVEDLMNGLSIATRILGFVNAPAFMQRVIRYCADDLVDVAPYAKNRTMLAQALRRSGYEFTDPEGAFFLFPKAPGGDDLAFCRRLAAENVLCVPGRGFGAPGYLRISYAVAEETVHRALPIFAAAAAAFSRPGPAAQPK